MPNWRPPPPEYIHDLLGPLKQDRGRFQRHRILPPPEFVCIHYIGGPKNCEQEYFNWKARPEIQNQTIFRTISLTREDPLSAYNIPYETVAYKLTFIPMDQTPFSDAQIAIGVFQE